MNQNSETPLASNLIKLNCSSFDASTPAVSNSQQIHNFIDFQQYKLIDHNFRNNKNLTINIEDNYQQCNTNKQTILPHKPHLTLQIDQGSQNQSNLNYHRQSEHKVNYPSLQLTNQKQSLFKYKKNQKSNNSLSVNTNKEEQYLNEIQMLTNKIVDLESQLEYAEQCNATLLQECQKNKQTIEQNKKDAQKLIMNLRKKQQSLELYREKTDLLQKKIIQIEKENIRVNQAKNLREQGIKQFQKKYQKVATINKQLQKEVREAQKKLVEVEKQIHKNTCHHIQQNVTRLKESSVKARETSATNKENQISINSNNQRKSLEGKKTTSTLQAKSQRTNSSNVNLLAKKLGHSIK